MSNRQKVFFGDDIPDPIGWMGYRVVVFFIVMAGWFFISLRIDCLNPMAVVGCGILMAAYADGDKKCRNHDCESG